MKKRSINSFRDLSRKCEAGGTRFPPGRRRIAIRDAAWRTNWLATWISGRDSPGRLKRGVQRVDGNKPSNNASCGGLHLSRLQGPFAGPLLPCVQDAVRGVRWDSHSAEPA